MISKRSVQISMALIAVVVGTAVSFAQERKGYDSGESLAKLKAIGRALQLYRQDYCKEPPRKWKSLSDAGVPPTMFVLAEKGHRWFLKDGKSAFKLSGVHIPRMGEMDFLHLYPPAGMPTKGTPYEKLPSLLAKRRAKLPIMSDPHLGLEPSDHKWNGLTEAFVLRIDGTVDRVLHMAGDPLDVFRQ